MLYSLYQKLYLRFGPQHWWPGDTKFEIIIGAILTQNTNWYNVARAIKNLKKAGVMTPPALYRISEKKLASLIRPSGYYNIKAKRVRCFLDYLFKAHAGSLRKMFSLGLFDLRREILAVKGIGPETADSILLYAGNLPVFVVDAYTRRIFERHKLIGKEAKYSEIQQMFMGNLKKDVKLFNEYHALIVRLGKEICKKNNPRCQVCPLK